MAKNDSVLRRDYAELPEGYEEAMVVDLQEDRHAMSVVSIACLAITAAMIVIGCFAVPPTELIEYARSDDFDLLQVLLPIAVLIVGTVAYIVLHELTHGVVIRMLSGATPTYGFSGMYFFAGADMYFCRSHYAVIALAPIVLWGIVLQAVLCMGLPHGWFWAVYFIQITNISGAAGDLYITALLRKLPASILVRDTGVRMTVFEFKRSQAAC